jgi:hypothetical protein
MQLTSLLSWVLNSDETFKRVFVVKFHESADALKSHFWKHLPRDSFSYVHCELSASSAMVVATQHARYSAPLVQNFIKSDFKRWSETFNKFTLSLKQVLKIVFLANLQYR